MYAQFPEPIPINRPLPETLPSCVDRRLVAFEVESWAPYPNSDIVLPYVHIVQCVGIGPVAANMLFSPTKPAVLIVLDAGPGAYLHSSCCATNNIP